MQKIMAAPAELAWEIEGRNEYYKEPARRAWALVAFMFEHEAYKVMPDGTTQPRESDENGRPVFRAIELNRQLLRAGAGYGGYHHAGAAGVSRTDLIKAMAADAEREGWVSRTRYRYGAIYQYTLTEAGRNYYRRAIKPQRDAFLEEYTKLKKAPSGMAAPHVAPGRRLARPYSLR